MEEKMRTKTKKKRTVPIRIAVDVIAELKKLGGMHDTYNDVLRRVLDMHKLKKGKATPKEKEIADKL